MVKEMQEKFDKYWKESYLTNCLPVILDPRYKYDYIEFRLKIAFGGHAEKYLDEVHEAIRVLFDEYAAKVRDSLEHSSQGANGDDVEAENDPLADWDQHLSAKKSQASNELDRYLKEELFPRREALDILQWWAVQSPKYPILSCMARDVLAVPASTVASESAFSTGGRVISDYRSRLSSDTVEALICLQDWLKADSKFFNCFF